MLLRRASAGVGGTAGNVRLGVAAARRRSEAAIASSAALPAGAERPNGGTKQPKWQPKRPSATAPLVAPAAAGASLAPRALSDAYKSFSECSDAKSLKSTYAEAAVGTRDESVTKRVAGRVVSLRDMGKVVFLTLHSDGVPLQVAANVSETFTVEQLQGLKRTVRAGDIIGVEGIPGKSKRGEVTVFLSSYKVLAPYVCTDLVTCPDQRGRAVIADQDVKYRYRFLDMINNPSSVAIFRTRHKLISELRRFLEELSFVEVETPMFNTIASGAAARPFTTHHNALDYDLHLRVAPELYLKQCVVGGMERVFEIGKVFRNEDCDRSHNPEFTSCELYTAYKTYRDLMPMTEKIFERLAIAARGTAVVDTVHPKTGKSIVVDFSQPFRRVSVLDEIQRVSGVTLPPAEELSSPRGIAMMRALLVREKVAIPTPATASKLFDKLIDHFVTDHVEQPTFVMDHPTFMSPLAKSHEATPALAERFELFINGMEMCNSYSELNDPQEQLKRFEQQLRDREQGDDESMQLDETFLKALQVGLPPTAGWGMGVDRAVMLLCGLTNIRDVILFPLLKPDDVSHDAKRRARTASFFDFNLPITLFYLSTLEAELQRRGERVDHLANLKRHIMDLSREGRSCDEIIRSFSPCAALAVDGLAQQYMRRSPLMCLISCLVCGGPKW